MSGPFTARWAGACGACGHPVLPGQAARYDGEVLVHDECPDPVDDLAHGPVCVACWLTLPCDCD